jgi:hypothetical protein
MDTHTDDGSRIVVALNPRTDEVKQIVSRRIVEFARQLASADLDDLGDVADVLEFPDGLGSNDVVQRAGITYRQLHYWTTHGYISTTRDSQGSGTPLLYPMGSVIKARVMGSLVNSLHMTPEAASDVADTILRDGSADVAGFRITSGGKS